MVARAYISNIAMGWPVKRQTDLLATHVAGWPNVPTYCDMLDARTRKTHSPTDLTQRAVMLRPTARHRDTETIYVASFAVLAWGKDDFAAVMEAVEKRGATLVALDGSDAPSVPAFAAARVQAARRQARENGTKAAAERRAAEAKARVRAHLDAWRNPALATADVLERMGVSRNTANKYAGNRELVLKRVAAAAKRKAKREQA